MFRAMGYEKRIPDPPKIVCDPEIMGGMPCVEGTRVPAETILDYINHDMTVYDVYVDYPYLPFGAVEAVAAWAVEQGREVKLPIRRMSDAEIIGRRQRTGL
jgi:uncharacterized protein (DUF433 family)